MNVQSNLPFTGSGPVGAESGYAETHISRLFFTPDRVYKMLKPVDVNFVSFLSTASRLSGIEAEYYLNSSVSPDVYLGVSDIVENDEVVDRMLVMKRLPAERQLSKLLRSHSDDHHSDATKSELQDCVREAARRIAVFHADQPALRGEAARPAGRSAMEINWYDNFTNLATLTRAGTGPQGGPVIDPTADAETAIASEPAP